MDGVSAAASIIAVVELAAKVGSQCYEYLLAVKSAKRDIEHLRERVESLKTTLEGAQKLLQGQNGSRLETSQKLRSTLESTRSELALIATRLGEKLDKGGRRATAMRSLGLRALKWPFESSEVESIVASLQRDQDTFTTALHIDQAAEVLDINEKIDLLKLPVAKGAAFNSQANEHEPTCHPETRLDALADIKRWVEDPSGKHVFWLSGMAGTGKSTISRTIAAHVSEKGMPLASFFMKKGEADRGRADMLFTTIACQLAHQLPWLIPSLREAILADSAIADKPKRQQLDKLILEPLGNCKESSQIPAVVLVVIDALDECDHEEDAKAVVRLLSRAGEVTTTRLKFFITSRPELHIRIGFKDVTDRHRDMVLHEISKPDVETDISVFLRFRLSQIRDMFNKTVPTHSKLSVDWPSPISIQHLVEMAVPLFIFASTACLFIEDVDCGDPDEQLCKVLDYHKAGGLTQLQRVYLPVLDRLLVKRSHLGMVRRSEDEITDIVAWFREIVGAIILLLNPLATAPLARLLGMPPRSVDSRLSGLHSVLHIPRRANSRVKLLHLSFRDFLVDPKSRDANPFWIDEKDTHLKLAKRCLELLSTGDNLRRDICNLRLPERDQLHCGIRVTAKAMPPEVRYACVHWVTHITASGHSLQDDDQVHRFLIQHLLHWLEALSFLCCVQKSINMVEDLMSLLDGTNSDQLSAFLYDMKRVILTNGSTVNRAPLQLYYSVIAFAPRNSLVRIAFRHELPTWLSVCSNLPSDWDACLQTLDQHHPSITSLTFSPDSRWLASTSAWDSRIRIWNVATGALTVSTNNSRRRHSQLFSGHGFSIAFSPDGSRLASVASPANPDEALDPWTCYLWDVASGECISMFKDGRCQDLFAFSPDGKWLASALRAANVPISPRVKTGVPPVQEHGLVKFWDMATGECIATVKTEESVGTIQSITFSPDSGLVALASQGHGVQLWDFMTRACISKFGASNLVAFSPDGTQLASVDREHAMLWDVATGVCTTKFDAPPGPICSSIAFTPGGSRLVLASETQLTLLHMATGKRIEMSHLVKKGSKACPTMSPDGSRLATASDDLIKLWDMSMEHRLPALGGSFCSIVSSLDNCLFASAVDHVVKLWDVVTGTCIKTFDTGADVHVAAFSPDGSLLVFQSVDGAYTAILDVTTGNTIAKVEGQPLLTISRDNSMVASILPRVYSRPEIQVRDLATDHATMTFVCDRGWVLSLAISPDGKLLAAGARGWLCVWDITTGSLIEQFHDTRSPTSISFSRDSSHVLYCNVSGKLEILQISNNTCTARLCVSSDLPNVRNITFDATTIRLDSSIGTYKLDLPPPPQNVDADDQLQQVNRQGIGLNETRTWITWGKHNVLWLPPAYRSEQISVVGGSTVAIAYPTGDVMMISFAGIESLFAAEQ